MLDSFCLPTAALKTSISSVRFSLKENRWGLLQSSSVTFLQNLILCDSSASFALVMIVKMGWSNSQ